MILLVADVKKISERPDMKALELEAWARASSICRMPLYRVREPVILCSRSRMQGKRHPVSISHLNFGGIMTDPSRR